MVLPAMAVCQAFAAHDARDRVALAFRALQLRIVSASEVRSALEAMPRVRGRRALEAVLDAFDKGAHSYLEMQGLRRVFSTNEFSAVIRQHTVRVDGRRFDLDIYDPGTLTAIELDGAGYHLSPDARQRDIRRDAALATLGIATVRFSYADVMDTPDRCREVARAVLAAREGTKVGRAVRVPPGRRH